MSLNWKEIDLLLASVDLNGSIIQDIWQFEHQSIVLTIHKDRRTDQLLLTTKRGFVRLCKDPGLKKSGKIKNQRFTQLLKSRTRGMRISDIRHIHKQRIVGITLSAHGNSLFLYFKMWNNGSNIILTEKDGMIIDALYRRPGSGITSGGRYNPEEQYADSKIDQSYEVRDWPENTDFSEYICRELSSAEENEELGQRKQRLIKRFDKSISRMQSSIEGKKSSLDSLAQWERLKEQGDLILSNAHLYQPGSSSITVADYYRNNETVSIPLDPHKSAQQNADHFYSKSRKLKQQQSYTQDEIGNLQQQLDKLLQKKKEIEESQTFHVIRDAESAISSTDKGNRPDSSQPGLRFESGGFLILAGRDAKENDLLLRRYAKGNDWWLHVRDYPGGYVFIKHQKNKSIPLDVLLDAGNIALLYSKAKNMKACDLYYTQVKYLRRVKEGKTGMVIPFQEKNLRIERDEKRLNRLLGRNS